MGIFQRKLKVDSDLSKVPTERLLKEYQQTGGATAALSAMAQAAESGTKEHPVQIDADALASTLRNASMRAVLEEELKRRGITPPG